jgi:hypothetical protein
MTRHSFYNKVTEAADSTVLNYTVMLWSSRFPSRNIQSILHYMHTTTLKYARSRRLYHSPPSALASRRAPGLLHPPTASSERCQPSPLILACKLAARRQVGLIDSPQDCWCCSPPSPPPSSPCRPQLVAGGVHCPTIGSAPLHDTPTQSLRAPSIVHPT